MSTLNELDILKSCLPLSENLSKYLLVKTKVAYVSDLECRIKCNLDTIVRKFGHSGWMEMKPLVVGIKCYTAGEKPAFVFVRHSDKNNNNSSIIDSFEAANDAWHPFKFPLIENYHTETRICMSDEVTAYTLAILNSSQLIRYENHTNYFPRGYASFETGSKALVYVDGDKTINPSSAALENAIKLSSLTSYSPSKSVAESPQAPVNLP